MTQRSSNEGGTTIKSVDTAFSLLEELEGRERAGVTELAEAIGRSKSTVHHYVATLERRNYLEKKDGKYRLSLRFLALGGQVREREALYQYGKNDVDKLADSTGELVRLIIEQRSHGLTVYQSEGDSVTNRTTHVGTIEPAYCTAAGKAFLAELPEERLESYIERTDFETRTEHTITDPDRLRAEIEQIRRTSVAFDDCECYDGIRCVATSVRGDDEVLGAISVSGPADHFPSERFRTEIPNVLCNVAGVVEINTTYSRWESPSDD